LGGAEERSVACYGCRIAIRRISHYGQKLEFEQNLKSLPLPIVILDTLSNSFETLQIFVPIVQRLLAAPLHKQLYVLEKNGNVIELISPRK
jgi:hypothetical protein